MDFDVENGVTLSVMPDGSLTMVPGPASSSQQQAMGYISHVISQDEIRMNFSPGTSAAWAGMGEPSHATITVSSQDPETKETVRKKFLCNYDGCARTYSTIGNLRTHQKRHTGDPCPSSLKMNFKTNEDEL
jgi:hypothetical protein